MNAKQKKKLTIAAIVVAVIAVLCFLESSGPFQHPEDYETDEYIAAEVALLRDFSSRYGEEALEDFRSSSFGWDMVKSGEVGRENVPWAIFKSRKAQMDWRKKNLKNMFIIQEKVWNRLRNRD
jgi:hypothetical protein